MSVTRELFYIHPLKTVPIVAGLIPKSSLRMTTLSMPKIIFVLISLSRKQSGIQQREWSRKENVKKSRRMGPI